jgi:hypothetical protein
MIAPTVLVVGVWMLRLPAETVEAERPPVKLDATEVVAPRDVTVARVSVSAGGAALIQAEPFEVRTFPEAPGVTMGIAPTSLGCSGGERVILLGSPILLELSWIDALP